MIGDTEGSGRLVAVRDQSLNDLVAAEIRATMARFQLAGNSLAAEMRTSTNSVSRRLRGITPLTLDDLDQVAAFLDVPLETLLAPAVAERDRRAAATAGKVTTKGSCSTSAGQRLAVTGSRSTAPAVLPSGSEHSAEWRIAS